MAMKKTGLILSAARWPGIFLLACLLAFSLKISTAQEKVQVFTNIDFNKAAPERINDYLRLESEIWKPIQQEHIRQGGIISWNVFRVWFAGTGSEYNYAVMEVYRNYEDMAFVYSDDIVTRVHPEINEAKLMEDTYRAREIVRAQSAERIAMLQPVGKTKPSQYVTVTYLDVGKSDVTDFEKNASGIIQAAFTDRMKSGLNLGWDLYRLILPGGNSVPYRYISFEYLDNMDKVVSAGWPAFPATTKTGTVYRSELWERVEYLMKD
jgi:hypothetical protein